MVMVVYRVSWGPKGKAVELLEAHTPPTQLAQQCRNSVIPNLMHNTNQFCLAYHLWHRRVATETPLECLTKV